MSCWDEEWDWGGRSASVGSSAELKCSLHTPDAIFRAGLSCRVEHCCISCHLSSQKMPRFRPQNIAAEKRREGKHRQAAPAPGQLLPAWRAALLSPFPAPSTSSPAWKISLGVHSPPWRFWGHDGVAHKAEPGACFLSWPPQSHL